MLAGAAQYAGKPLPDHLLLAILVVCSPLHSKYSSLIRKNLCCVSSTFFASVLNNVCWKPRNRKAGIVFDEDRIPNCLHCLAYCVFISSSISAFGAALAVTWWSMVRLQQDSETALLLTHFCCQVLSIYTPSDYIWTFAFLARSLC